VSAIKVTSEFGLIIRKRALSERALGIAQVFEAMEAAQPYGESDELLAFGPSFGPEALDTFTKRLQKLGLEYWDDFFEFAYPHPSWCTFRAEYLAEAVGDR
jgi:hypothetical protein